MLGNHVQQKGSLVNSELLRFDFAHFAKMTDQEIAKVEQIVNKKIRENIALDEKRNVPIKQAMEYGATALFGEKYGDFVRVITFDPKYSVELCGGTHVSATGNIGLLKIVSESSVAAGVRRIEALTASKAEQYINERLAIGDEVSNLFKNPKDLIKAVEVFLEEKLALQKALEKYEADKIQQIKKDLLNKVAPINGLNTIIVKVDITNAEAIKTLAFELKNQVENIFCVLVAETDGKPHIAVIIADNIVKDKGLNASNIVRELAKEVQGGGGGQPFFATAGGKDLSGLDNVLKKAMI